MSLGTHFVINFHNAAFGAGVGVVSLGRTGRFRFNRLAPDVFAGGQRKLAHLHDFGALRRGNFQFEIQIGFFRRILQEVIVCCMVQIFQSVVVGDTVDHFPTVRIPGRSLGIGASVQRPVFGISAVIIFIVIAGGDGITGDLHGLRCFKNDVSAFEIRHTPFCVDVSVHKLCISLAVVGAGCAFCCIKGRRKGCCRQQAHQQEGDQQNA